MTDVQKSQSAPLLGGSPPTFEQRESELGSGDPQPQVTIETEVLPLSAKEQVNPEEQTSEQPTDTRKDINPQTENPENETSFSRTQRIVSEQVLNPISQMWRRATSGATNVIHPGDLPQPGQMAEKLRQSLPPASGVVDRVKENIPRAKEMMSNLAQTIPEKASGMVETIKQNAPQASGMVETIRQSLPDVPSMEGITSDQVNPETLKKQAVSLYFITAIPAVMTVYRAFLANEGPTWFSFHPTMMMVSITSLLTAMLLQRFGGKDNITLIGTLSVTSIISMIISIYAVWSAKEMYAKVHFLSIHSHFGGMTIFGLLIYALGAFYVFKPTEGAERVDRKWQQYLVTWGKGTATLALCSQLLGVIEIERTWTFLFIWMASLFLMTPFLILPWNKSDITPRV